MAIESKDSPRWLRTREAARLLNVSDSTIRSWLRRDKIDGFK
jgi:excisionase family DNA binding protein